MEKGEVSKAREYSLRAKYGISPAQYAELLERTGGCNLCSKTEEEEGKSLAVDHNHKTGEVRGVLCTYCNHRVIGRHTDPDLLRRMADYIERGTGWFVPEKKKKKRKPRGTQTKTTRRRHRVATN